MIENWYKLSQTTAYTPTQEDMDIFARDPWVIVDSSFIDAIAYYDVAWVLEVRLKNGRKYTFMDVPKKVYDAFLASPSKGTFFNQVLKRNYTKS